MPSTGEDRSRPILLSFDVEEFDIAAEYGRTISADEQFEVGRRGLDRVLALLVRHPARPVATCFVTAAFAERFPDFIRRAASAGHEIASHGFTHGPLQPGDLERSKAALERVTGAFIAGFRRARMAPTDERAIAAAGYLYNSSEHPVWLPGRFNNFFRPRRPYRSPAAPSLVNIPVSATPLLRIPLFWLAFKNFPVWFNRAAARWTLSADGAVNFYWHPWEFCDLSPYRLPRHIAGLHGDRLLDRLDRHISWLARLGHFETFRDFARRVR